MNFLSHYYTTDADINPYKLLGVILPDIAKDFSRTYNQKVDGIYFPVKEELKAIKEGLELHVKGDDLFHRHEMFLDLEAYAKKVLQEKKEIEAKRKYIIAHVMVELMIDQYIINKSPQTVKDFYSRLKMVNLEIANGFFEEINVPEEDSHFKNNFKFFREKMFLFRLKENEGIIFTLEKVFGRLFNASFTSQNGLWQEVIEDVKIKLNQDLPVLLEDLKISINE